MKKKVSVTKYIWRKTCWDEIYSEDTWKKTRSRRKIHGGTINFFVLYYYYYYYYYYLNDVMPSSVVCTCLVSPMHWIIKTRRTNYDSWWNILRGSSTKNMTMSNCLKRGGGIFSPGKHFYRLFCRFEAESDTLTLEVCEGMFVLC